MNILKWLDDHLEEVILVLLLIVMTLVMGVQIFSRYALKNSLSWSEELTRFLFVWSGFIGLAYTVKKNSAIKIENFRQVMPAAIQKTMIIAEWLVSLGLFVVMLVAGTNVVNATLISQQTSAALQLPMWIVQICVPISAGLAIFRTLQQFYRLFTGKTAFVQDGKAILVEPVSNTK